MGNKLAGIEMMIREYEAINDDQPTMFSERPAPASERRSNMRDGIIHPINCILDEIDADNAGRN